MTLGDWMFLIVFFKLKNTAAYLQYTVCFLDLCFEIIKLINEIEMKS